MALRNSEPIVFAEFAFARRYNAGARKSTFVTDIQEKGLGQNQIDSQRTVRNRRLPRAELQLRDNTFKEDILGEIIVKESATCLTIGKQSAICQNMRKENAVLAKRPCVHMHAFICRWDDTSRTLRERVKTE
jgi:hypothetical protein